MQLISQMDQIFKLERCGLWLKPYEIMSTGSRCGLIEVVSDALSIDHIKRKLGPNSKLVDYFTKQFGDKKSKSKIHLVHSCRVPQSQRQLLQIFGSLLPCLFHLVDQGQAQRQHPS